MTLFINLKKLIVSLHNFVLSFRGTTSMFSVNICMVAAPLILGGGDLKISDQNNLGGGGPEQKN